MSRHHAAVKNDPRYKAATAAGLERDGHRCVRCGATDDLQSDHIVALANGGDPFNVDNRQTLCGDCNRKKGDKVIERVQFVNPRWFVGSEFF